MTTLRFRDGTTDTGCLTSWRRETVTLETRTGRHTYPRRDVLSAVTA